MHKLHLQNVVVRRNSTGIILNLIVTLLIFLTLISGRQPSAIRMLLKFSRFHVSKVLALENESA